MSDWFTTTPVAQGITLTTEPWVNDYFRANCYTVQGRETDLQFDFCMGLVPLRPALPLSGKPVFAIASHGHIDHIGGFHEFETRLGHAAEAAGFASMAESATLKHSYVSERYGPALLRPPHPDFTLATWELTPAPLTRTLADGDSIDLGNRRFTVLHLPGHSPGGIALLDEADGVLLAGDVIYDDSLLDELPGSNIPDYLASMQRLLDLDCRLILAGHGAAFDRPRMQDLARAYIASRS